MWEVPPQTQPRACDWAPLLEEREERREAPEWPHLEPTASEVILGPRLCSQQPLVPPLSQLTSFVLSSLAPRVSMSSLRELVGPEMYDAPVSTTTMQPSSQTTVADLTDTLGEASWSVRQTSG